MQSAAWIRKAEQWMCYSAGLDSPAEASAEGAAPQDMEACANAQKDIHDGDAASGLPSPGSVMGCKAMLASASAALPLGSLTGANVALYHITASCGSKESAMHLQCHVGSESSACQVTIAGPNLPSPACCPALTGYMEKPHCQTQRPPGGSTLLGLLQ